MDAHRVKCRFCAKTYPRFWTWNGKKRSGMQALVDHVHMCHPEQVEAWPAQREADEKLRFAMRNAPAPYDDQ